MDRPVTLITGTRTGIGKCLAHHYVRRGHVVIGCSREEPDWTLDGYEHVIADVAEEEPARKVFASIRQRYGRLDHLINNAGIAAMNHSLLTPLSTVHKVLNTNVVGTFLWCREAAKVMQQRGRGRIVNFTTVALPLKLEGEAIYVASKAAVLALTEVLARELAEFGITVNAVGPVPIETDLTRGVPRDKMERLIARQAIPRWGNVQSVAHVVDFFLHDASDMITGQNVYLGGV